MKSLRKLISTLLVICLTVSITGCSPDNSQDSPPISPTSYPNDSGDSNKEIERFLKDAVGDWFRFGNLYDESLEILGDGTWVYLDRYVDGRAELLATGTIKFNEFDEDVMQYEDEMSNRRYACNPVKDGILYFNGRPYIHKEDSILGLDQYEGDWYIDGDRDKDYYKFESGEWRFYEASGMGHSSTSSESGYLIWHGGKDVLVADLASGEYNPFAIFTIEGEELKSGGKSYVRVEFDYEAFRNDDDWWNDDDDWWNDDDDWRDEDDDWWNEDDDWRDEDDDRRDEDDDWRDEDDDGDGDKGYEGDAYGEDSHTDGSVETGVFYYRQGNPGLDSMYFYSDDTVDIDSPGYETIEGTYTAGTNTLMIWIYDEMFEFTIYTEQGILILEDEYGNKYWQ